MSDTNIPSQSSSSSSTTINSPTSSSSSSSSSRQVSEVAFEFLVTEIVHWIQQGHSSNTKSSSSSSITSSDQHVIQLEQNAAKMERMGYDIGYRFTERLACTRGPFFPLPTGLPTFSTTTTTTTIPSSSGTNTVESTTAVITTSSTNNNNMTMYQIQLEVVKFICKDFWITIFHKQMDRLQTNHRGTFVLKDFDFVWLKRFKYSISTNNSPGGETTTTTTGGMSGSSSGTAELILDESTRMIAMQYLAFICGMIRGVLASFGIGGDDDMEEGNNTFYECEDTLQQTSSTVVVTCDLFADGKTLESCNFQIKIIPKEISE